VGGGGGGGVATPGVGCGGNGGGLAAFPTVFCRYFKKLRELKGDEPRRKSEVTIWASPVGIGSEIESKGVEGLKGEKLHHKERVKKRQQSGLVTQCNRELSSQYEKGVAPEVGSKGNRGKMERGLPILQGTSVGPRTLDWIGGRERKGRRVTLVGSQRTT